jgi:hypothetical protein
VIGDPVQFTKFKGDRWRLEFPGGGIVVTRPDVKAGLDWEVRRNTEYSYDVIAKGHLDTFTPGPTQEHFDQIREAAARGVQDYCVELTLAATHISEGP